MTKIDPIAKKYRTAEIAEKFVGGLFWACALLSFLMLIVDTKGYVDCINKLFIIGTIILFLLGLYVRLGAFAQAEECRVGDFLGRAFDTTISPDATTEYYNDGETRPVRKIASQLLENLFFTKNIAGAMRPVSRFLTFIYFIAWLWLAITRDIPLPYVVVAAQVLFSEQVFSKWLRLEWLYARSTMIYEELYRIISAPPARVPELSSLVLRQFVIYERVKATASMMLSPRIFRKMNGSLGAEWERIKENLGIAS